MYIWHLWVPVVFNSPGSSVHGTLHARTLEWVAMPSSGESSQPRDRTGISYVSCIGNWVLYHESHLGSPCLLLISVYCEWTSLVAQMVKRLPTMRKTRVQSLDWEDLLQKEMATHPSVLAWKIPWTEDPGYNLQTTVHGVAKSGTRLSNFTFTYSEWRTVIKTILPVHWLSSWTVQKNNTSFPNFPLNSVLRGSHKDFGTRVTGIPKVQWIVLFRSLI